MSHSRVPKLMIQGVIKPVLKGNSISKAKCENSRAVMNSSMLLDMLEYCLLLTISQNLKITPLQYGFREGSNCVSAIAIVKKTILRY